MEKRTLKYEPTKLATEQTSLLYCEYVASEVLLV